jgi:alkylation response protein AidB-like acyl-CoA dehydrogenase
MTTALGTLASPLAFLQGHLPSVPAADVLAAHEALWFERGQAVADAVDRAGTPHLRMFDTLGRRVDEVLYPPGYWEVLRAGYARGVVWRAFAERSLVTPFLLGYLTSYFDTGIYCPYTVSLSTAVPLDKYGSADLKARFLEPLTRRDATGWQGATWMTEAGGGSDLGATVETVAREVGDGSWRLDGDKYFASNAGADVAVVAARPEGAPAGVRGLELFLVPRQRHAGGLNYAIRRLKDKIGTRLVPTGEVELRASEGYLLGSPGRGVYHILEVLNVSRVANSIGSVGLAQRALADAVDFARARVAFGRPVLEHALLASQVAQRLQDLEAAFALAWEAVSLLDQVWRETPPYSDRYHLFRLVAHLAKYWTAENAAQTAKWALEVCAGPGTLAENRVERWLRDAMILAIWEGTPHRQMLDGLEVMEKKGAHRLLLDHLKSSAAAERQAWRERIDAHLALPRADREARVEPLFRDLAAFTAWTLARRAGGG